MLKWDQKSEFIIKATELLFFKIETFPKQNLIEVEKINLCSRTQMFLRFEVQLVLKFSLIKIGSGLIRALK